MTAEAALETLILGAWRAELHARLGSTNDRARELAVAGDVGRVWVVADEQLSGRGRHERVWTSPPGNLYASALILDPCPIALGAEIGFVAGVAAQRACADLGVTSARLKWPNDLQVGGAKLAGLLVEGLTTPQRRFAAIVGIGVNVASAPQVPAYPTTSLSQLAGRPITARALFERLAARFEESLGVWARGAGFSAIRESWLAAAAGLGGPIRVNDAKGAREGRFAGLDERGRLKLERDGVMEIIESADLTLISAPSGATEGVRA